MNKYKKSFNSLDWLRDKHHEEQKVLLQELVDKETPMKPYINDRYCGRCDLVRLLPQNNYCSNCGQKIDWSKENE